MQHEKRLNISPHQNLYICYYFHLHYEQTISKMFLLRKIDGIWGLRYLSNLPQMHVQKLPQSRLLKPQEKKFIYEFLLDENSFQYLCNSGKISALTACCESWKVSPLKLCHSSHYVSESHEMLHSACSQEAYGLFNIFCSIFLEMHWSYLCHLATPWTTCSIYGDKSLGYVLL